MKKLNLIILIVCFFLQNCCSEESILQSPKTEIESTIQVIPSLERGRLQEFAIRFQTIESEMNNKDIRLYINHEFILFRSGHELNRENTESCENIFWFVCNECNLRGQQFQNGQRVNIKIEIYDPRGAVPGAIGILTRTISKEMELHVINF